MTILWKTTNERQAPRLVPPISLELPEKKTLAKWECHTYKLCSTPNEADSPMHMFDVPFFGSGTCEEYLIFQNNFDKAAKGQGTTSGPGQFALARHSLVGEALTMFENKFKPTGGPALTETVPHCTQCLNAVRKGVFPANAASVQKRCMCRYLHKPRKLSIREWLA